MTLHALPAFLHLRLACMQHALRISDEFTCVQSLERQRLDTEHREAVNRWMLQNKTGPMPKAPVYPKFGEGEQGSSYRYMKCVLRPPLRMDFNQWCLSGTVCEQVQGHSIEGQEFWGFAQRQICSRQN